MLERRSTKGFSLVELSISLAIISLIVAGVVTGKSLVSQAKLRAALADFQGYSMSYAQFYNQYNALPGDFARGYAYWNTDCAASTTACDGNNNGQIEYAGVDDSDREIMRAWQHLSLAELVPGTYSGTADPVTFNTPDNSPHGAVVDTYMFFQALPEWAWGKSNSLILMGACTLGSWCGAMDAIDAKRLDSKIDDGVANLGKLFAISGDGLAANSCSAAKGEAGGADFNLNSSVTRSCILVYQQMR